MMNKVVNKALLVAILPDIEKYDEVTPKLVDGTLTLHYTRQGYRHTPNIYELMHTAKLWAKSAGYLVESDNTGKCRIYPTDRNGNELKMEWEFNGNTEYEAVFAACTHILEQEASNNDNVIGCK